MATTETYVSPGVFTREIDYSGLAQGIANIGGAIVAPFSDGPAFFPTVVTNAADLEEKFGVADGTLYGPYTAMKYLRQQGQVTVVRTGGLTGYWQKNPLIIYADPGVWLRNGDVAELYDTSFMYVNSEEFTQTIAYQHDAVQCGIDNDTTTPSTDDELEYNTNEDYYKHGIWLYGKRAEKPDFESFIYTVSGSLDVYGIDQEQYLNLSSSLIKAYEDGVLVTLTSKQLFTAFTYNNIYSDRINKDTVATKGTKKLTDMAGYDIAWFEIPRSFVTGSLYCQYYEVDDTTGERTRVQKTVNIVPFGNGVDEAIYMANLVENSNAIFKFVKIDPVVSNTVADNVPNKYLTDTNTFYTSYTKDIGVAWNLTTATLYYDTSYITKIEGQINASFGKSQATATTISCDYNGKDSVDATLNGGINYAGKTLNTGKLTVSGVLARPAIKDGEIDETTPILSDSANTTVTGLFYMSSSAQATICTEETAVAAAIAESTVDYPLFSTSFINKHNESEETCSFNSENSAIRFIEDSDYFQVIGNAMFNDVKFTARRGYGTCAVTLGLTGIISGSFGGYNGEFVPDSIYEIDPCNPVTTGRQPMVLAVLANTLNAATQWNSEKFEVYGFSSSVINQNVSTTAPYIDSINPAENNYTLDLKYSYTDDNDNVIEGTYGSYEFSLDESSNSYIKNVFGTNPKVGDPEKQIIGQKVEAAYNYLLFEDSIKKFVAEKTLPEIKSEVDSSLVVATRGWKIRVTTGDNFSIGQTMKFTDNYSTDLEAGDSEFAITNAYTPWIYSQKIAPFKGTSNVVAIPTKYKLFRVHTLSDGTLSNKKYKIEISNVKLAGTVPGSNYGTFTLAIRKFSDTDKRPKYLEIFQNLTMDPDSANFIARRIGDYYAYITFAGKMIEFGTYDNLSKYIRIEVADTLYPETVVPYGFEAYSAPIGSSATSYLPTVKYSKASIYSLNVGRYPSGTVFGSSAEASNELRSLYPQTTEGVGVDVDTLQYFKPLPSYGEYDSNGNNIDFDLEDPVVGIVDGIDYSEYYAQGSSTDYSELLDPELKGAIPSTFDAVNENTYVKMRKFVVGFQGGFDGQWPAIPVNLGSDITPGNTQGLDCTNINSAGSIAYKQCIAAIGNADEFDINLIATPGLFYQYHPYVCGLVIDMCERRGDCFYIIDNIVFPKSNQSVGLVDAAVESVATLDTNYAATYYPWVKILDTNLNKIISVPPSVVMPAVYAASDKNSAGEWYSPAGLNRGGIEGAVQVLDRLTHSERDTLYNGRVNPIVAFPGQGIVVWGQKTLQLEQSALDRVNVRRLLIAVKKYIASVSRYLVFEQNVAATRNKFLSIVNPYMEGIQQRNGFYAFQVQMDSNNNTDDLIDRLILKGDIRIKPAKAIEYIALDFSVYSTGASFEEH